MANLVDTVVRTAQEQKSQQNQRKSTVVRVCGEEHWAKSTGTHNGQTEDVATLYFATDPEMAYLSQMKFKMILGDPKSPTSIPPSSSGNISGYNVVTAKGVLDTTHAPWTSVREFFNYANGGGVDMDGAFGMQCWDLADYFWVIHAGRTLLTGNQSLGEYGVYYSWTKTRATNAGSEFDLITNPDEIIAGDWVVMDFGSVDADYGTKLGHIAMAMQGAGSPNYTQNGCLWMLGQNQAGGVPYTSGGAWANPNNINIRNTFVGAFRYRGWTDTQDVPGY